LGKIVKAILNTKYRSPDVLRLEEIAKPTPRENEVLIENHVTSVNAADVVGRVEAVGRKVK